ncbi:MULTISPECIES: alpha/beta hydrolase [Acidobacteriaceae]|uniref:alpha/beta hydrolase n=1 Tax=Acidobacteriaceae TaxID=204434 RepID=UPI002110DA8A|nr:MULTISPECIES: alpha/beta hydrolase [Acidobacteriaceae]MDW5265396.1 alpha/beta hydrolase [Edaphobacter sp.]
MLEGQCATVDRSTLRKETFIYVGREVLIVRSRRCTGICSPVFFLHGGGWLMGDAQTHAYLIAELAERSRCAIVFIHYPLAPEVQFPESQDIAFSAIRGVLADSAKHEINANQFAIAGDSAGGNLAACLALRFQREGLPRPKLQILLYPALDARMRSVSYRAFGKGLNLTERTMRWFWQQYGRGKGDLENPLYSPACVDDKVLQGLPETLIITSEFDVLRDEAEDFAKRLRRAGVSVCSVRFGGVLHGFMVTESLAKDISGDLAIQLAADYLRRRLEEHPMPGVEDQASGMRCGSL